MILDAGANCGFASIQIALLFPKAKVVALEPSPDNFKALKRKIILLL
jgi:FkbM family methyltransferase